MVEQFPRQSGETVEVLQVDDHIELGYNNKEYAHDGKTVPFRFMDQPLETGLAREEVTWREARAADVEEIIHNAQNEKDVEEHVIRFIDVDANQFANTKTGEITLPNTNGLSPQEQSVVLARALIEDVRATEQHTAEETIKALREELDALYALVTPDMAVQASVIHDQAEQIKALQTQNEVLRSRAERPARTLKLNAGFLRTSLSGLNIGLRA